MRRSALAAVLAAAALVTPLAGAQAAGQPATTATASSGSPGALSDGAPGAGQLGAEWSASSGDTAPWAQLAFSGTRRIASVQVFGSTADASDPAQSTAAALYGTLRFSDGSTVDVPGIAAGAAMPTTVAFTPRSVTWVRLELRRQIASAPVALRELTAYDAGTTPPQWAAPAGSPTYAVTPAPASCSATTTSAVAPPLAGRLTLACPTPGSSADAAAVVVVDAPAGSRLTAWLSVPSASALDVPLRRAATATADATGRAVLTADVRRLPQGPFALKVTATTTAGAALDPLYAQLFRTGGSPASTPSAPAGSSPPAGMTLQYSDDFDAPLSISASGWGSRYAAVKPEPWGGSQFGDALFADPAWGAGTLATLPGGYLRVRAQPVGVLAPRQTWGQAHASGILSSQLWGGSGFSAQHGYFEARMLGAPGPGSWPAFWMLNSASGTGRADGTAAEVDAVELYGHDTDAACHTTHSWGAAKTGQKACQGYPVDWAAQWHTYGVRVLDGGADFYLDGRKVASLGELSHTDEPFFFMLDLATGGGWPVDLAATGQTTDLYVDWVRVYT
ncbi:family 16 glycosylhydrolase [Quadrisphaera oryzae]|uniref:family 16 glycosylhydrolase n=1 Tax=Quadrisphaera TaxID=317661 RepID=UPI0016485A36|nr:family 16 glycosylhydrolase [Quadrisphaera sp. RL12-1S]MBC3761721.1 glycoside hydrolase family 16 protein [Quadrisphaera sp. RL12-1S]